MNNDLSAKDIVLFIYKALLPFRRSIIIMYLVAIAWAIDLSLRPYVLKIIVDRISQPLNQNVFNTVGFPVAIYFAMTFIYLTLFRIYGYVIEVKMIPNLRRNIANLSFSSLLKQSYAYYQSNFAGSLTNKVNDLTTSIPEIVQIALDRFFSHALALIIAIFTLWHVNSIFAFGMLSWSIAFIIGSLLVSKKITHLADVWSECGSTITGKMVDSLSNLLSVRLFAREGRERTSLNATFDKAVNAEQKLQKAYFWIWFCYGYSFVMVQGISLYFLLKGRQEGWITVGDFVVVLSINFAIADFLWQLTKDFSQFSKLWGTITQALRTTQVRPDIEDKSDAKTLQASQGLIVFDNVQFNYKNTQVLFQNKSIIIGSGQKVGLVGYSGGGKSTFVNLILRLYDVTEGRILIDGQDIRDVTQDSLRENIATIPQDPSLFHRSIMENIRYGSIDASDEDVIMAAKRAHAHDFIMKLPYGYASLVGERGVKLSGGQRQRVAIARAILKNAPILILDEATSQLDSITESDIQDSLLALIQKGSSAQTHDTLHAKTVIVIAHRLSTLLHMDRILVFENGKIVEDGSHPALLAKNGLYKSFWDAQVGGFLQT